MNIDFKNPFFEAHDFILRIDNPSFTSGAKSPLKIDVIFFKTMFNIIRDEKQ